MVRVGSQGKIWGLIPTFLENMYLCEGITYLMRRKKAWLEKPNFLVEELLWN